MSENGKEPYVLRNRIPGDMGWITQAHAKVYSKEYGWDDTFEALVGKITSDIILNFDYEKENFWIAEIDGEIVGSVGIVKKDDKTAKLRLLILDPKARGMGLGKRLVRECIDFSRKVGYEKIVLWTVSNLESARYIYKSSGFEIVETEESHDFGVDLVNETWELKL